MKTLLSLTSRTFGKARVRVFFELGNKPKDSVDTGKGDKTRDGGLSEATIARSTAAALFVLAMGIPDNARAETKDTQVETKKTPVAIALATAPVRDTSTIVVPQVQKVKTTQSDDIEPLTEEEERGYTVRTNEARDFLMNLPKELRQLVAGQREENGNPQLNLLQAGAIKVAREVYDNLNNQVTKTVTSKESEMAKNLSFALGINIDPLSLRDLPITEKQEDLLAEKNTDLAIEYADYKDLILKEKLAQAETEKYEMIQAADAILMRSRQQLAEAKGIAEAYALLAGTLKNKNPK